jgi:serine/threonine protein kinase
MLYETVGSDKYMAPEVATVQQTGKGYDGRKADVWSFGVSLYTMLLFNFPFSASLPAKCGLLVTVEQAQRAGRSTIDTILMQYGLSKDDYDVPKEIWDLLGYMLHVDPSRRPSMEEIYERLKSKW